MNKYRRYTAHDKLDILKNTYLSGEAYNTVKELPTLDEIWVRLQKDFGNPTRMLKDKLTEIVNNCSISKIEGVSAKSDAVLRVINLLSDVFTLANEHELMLDLYCKNDQVLGQMITQLPRLWLHDWQLLKKQSKDSIDQAIRNAPAWTKDKLYWELFKKFLEDQLANLKDEQEMEETLKNVSIDDEKCRSKAVCASYPAS